MLLRRFSIDSAFAFLGPAYDKQLEEIYTKYSTDDLIIMRPILSAITGSAAVSTEPMQALVARHFNQKVIDAIAAEWREKGRTLLIGTTDLGYEMARKGYPWAKSPPGFE